MVDDVLMAYALRVIHLGNVLERPTGDGLGAYCVTFDPDAYDGGGLATFTWELAEAATFPDIGSLMAFYRQQSTVRPFRADGKPNRPLTALTVEIVNLDTLETEKTP